MYFIGDRSYHQATSEGGLCPLKHFVAPRAALPCRLT